MTGDLVLRDVVEDDLPIFFEHQSDPDANYMAAFTAKDPTDRAAFAAHWSKIMADATVIVKTIVLDGQVVGSVMSYEEYGKPRSLWARPTGAGNRSGPEAFLASVKHGAPHVMARSQNLAHGVYGNAGSGHGPASLQSAARKIEADAGVGRAKETNTPLAA